MNNKMSAKQKKTNMYSYMLRSSPIGGVGVFALHNIKKGTVLHVFTPNEKTTTKYKSTNQSKNKMYDHFCVYDAKTSSYFCPANFTRLSIGWYLNHSESPSAVPTEGDSDYKAARNIRAGEEITIDYHIFGPGNMKFLNKKNKSNSG
jgi:SET domain-containing protein